MARLFGVRTMRLGFEASSINVSIARVVVGSSAKLTNSRYFRRAMRADARFYEVARRYGIAERILFRWKQELTQVATLFVAVDIADTTPADRGARVMTLLPPGVKVHLAFGFIDMRNYVKPRISARASTVADAGAGRTAAGSVLRPSVCVPRSHSSQPRQDHPLGRYWTLSLHQAARARRAPVARRVSIQASRYR
jgi:hypothetical protein